VHPWECFELFWRFLLVSLTAFGGSGSALPLVERMTVRETGWLTEGEFASALGSTYLMPGPILMMATFVGYRVDGLAGALAATFGVFIVPWVLAGSAAWVLRPYLERRWLRAFGAGAGTAVVGLQVATAFDLARHNVTSWPLAAVVVAVLLLSLKTQLHPLLLLSGGAVVGALAS
jgi:chromate transporter